MHSTPPALPRIPVWPGVSAFAGRYDAFVLDLWGVIHDGLTAYPGAVDALLRLKAAGKRSVLLSNAPRRASVLVTAMEAMGIPRTAYDEILTSGEVVYRKLRDRDDPAYAGLGKKLYFLGQAADRNVFAGLDYVEVDDPARADFYLVTGPLDFNDPLSAYDGIVARFAASPKPLICANPDRVVIRDGRNVVCAGTIADLYAAQGGPVVFTGKPNPDVYGYALDMLGGVPRDRAVGVGDSFDTDVPGCTAAGIDVVLCAGGIHADALGIARGETPSAEAVGRLAAAHGLAPVGAIPAFVWE